MKKTEVETLLLKAIIRLEARKRASNHSLWWGSPADNYNAGLKDAIGELKDIYKFIETIKE